MRNSNSVVKNEQAIQQKNRQVINNASATNELNTTHCNYTNNYYGDQLCQPVVSANTCNYSDNYYGDQLCQSPDAINAIKASSINAVATQKSNCNYSNNYYGDQLCKAAS